MKKLEIRAVGVALGIALGAVLACDSETSEPPPPEVELADVATELIAVICGPIAECDCGVDSMFQSEDQCVTWANQQQTMLESMVDTNSLVWDPTCLGRAIAPYVDVGCGSDDLLEYPEPEGEGCQAPCSPVHGSKAIGAACVRFDNGMGSDCQQGLFCDGVQCQSQCPIELDLGEDCNQPNVACGTDAFCDPLSMTCLSAADEGESCMGRQCRTGLRCIVEDPTDPMSDATCFGIAAEGESCMGHADCETGYCPAGFCESLPTEGESCRGTNICEGDLVCVEETCQAAPLVGEVCTSDCARGLDCIDGVCFEGRPAVCWPQLPLAGVGI